MELVGSEQQKAPGAARAARQRMDGPCSVVAGL